MNAPVIHRSDGSGTTFKDRLKAEMIESGLEKRSACVFEVQGVGPSGGRPRGHAEGTPFGPGIASMIAYLHGCQMIGSIERATLRRDRPLRSRLA